MQVRKRSFALAAVLTVAFSALSLPILAMVMGISYVRNLDAIRDVVRVHNTIFHDLSIKGIKLFIEPARRLTKVVAVSAGHNPEIFEDERGNDLLYHALTRIARIDAFYITRVDGFTRSVTRVSPHRRRTEPTIPPETVWSIVTSPPLSPGSAQMQREEFFSTWETKIGESLEPAFDGREAPNYLGVAETRDTFVAPLIRDASTVEPVVSIGSPIIIGGEFKGMIGADISLYELSSFLTTSRISQHALVAIVDEDGSVIANSESGSLPGNESPSIDIASIRGDVEKRIRESINSPNSTSSDFASFDITIEGIDCAVSVFKLTNEFGLNWHAFVVTPLSDFAAPLQNTNKILIALLAILFPLELWLIARMSRMVSRGIGDVASKLDEIRAMNLTSEPMHMNRSRVREISALQNGLSLLKEALRSFAQYVPIDIVKGLTRSGESVTLGVERRELSIMFCDLEDFSTAAQELPPDQLLEQISAYFAVVTAAVARTGGTVDKFIGDAVMAFWNAPSECAEHAYHACEAALEITAALTQLNLTWERSGKKCLRARIGINSAQVLVGNIGTPERFSYTALGDGVNVAARLQTVNKDFGTYICLSDETYHRAQDRVTVRPLRPVSVKGRKGEFMIYELQGLAVIP